MIINDLLKPIQLKFIEDCLVQMTSLGKNMKIVTNLHRANRYILILSKI